MSEFPAQDVGAFQVLKPAVTVHDFADGGGQQALSPVGTHRDGPGNRAQRTFEARRKEAQGGFLIPGGADAKTGRWMRGFR